MAYEDVYLSDDGNDANSGLTNALRVRSAARVAAVVAGVVGRGNLPYFRVGQYDFSLGAGAQALFMAGSAAGGALPDGWKMGAYDPTLPWHIRDHRVINTASDFRQVYTNDGGATYNVQKDGRTIPNMTDNAGSPVGVGTGIWAVNCSGAVSVIPAAGDAAYKVDRLWIGGAAATLGSATAYLSSQNAFNEAWEATNFSTLGKDGTHIWTSLTPSEVWAAGSTVPGSNVVFVYCPQGNPATVWGGITVHSRRSHGFMSGAAGGTGGQYGLVTVADSNGWTIDSSLRLLGGGFGTAKVAGICDSWRFDCRAQAMSPFYGNFQFSSLGSGARKTFSNFTIAPMMDAVVNGKPYYPINTNHTEGGSDMIQFSNPQIYVNAVIAGNTAAGEKTYLKDPAHGAISSVGSNADINGLEVEKDLSITMGGMQYQRALVFNGDRTTLRKMVFRCKVFNQSSPSQLDGDVRCVGMEFNNAEVHIRAHPDGDTSGLYKGRFNIGGTRAFHDTHPDGKNRDGYFLDMNVTGIQDVVDCVFHGNHACAIRLRKYVSNNPAAPNGTTEFITLSNNLFVAKSHPAAQQAAIMVDARSSLGQGVRLINNAVVGFPAAGGAQHVEDTGYYRHTGPLESLNQAFVFGAGATKGGDGAGVAVNVGWKRYATLADYRAVQNRQTVL